VREGLGPTGRLWATDSSPDATLTGDVHAGGSRSAPKQGRWGGLPGGAPAQSQAARVKNGLNRFQNSNSSKMFNFLKF
jgi:hypothetical protein